MHDARSGAAPVPGTSADRQECPFRLRCITPIAFAAFAVFAATVTVHAPAIAATRSMPVEQAASRPASAAPASRQNLSNEEAFWDALTRDDAARVQTFLLRGIDNNIVHPQHGPAIVTAARERAWNVVRTLAGIVGTRIDAPNERGETAAMLAALRGNLDIVRLLVEKGAELNRPGWTVLHYAAADGNVELLQYLLDQHAYIDAESPNRTTPLMMAARHENIDAVRLLVAAGADPTVRNQTGFDAARYLESHRMTEEARWMREQAEAFARRYRGPGRPAARAPENPGARAGVPEAGKSERSAAPAGKSVGQAPAAQPDRSPATQPLAPPPAVTGSTGSTGSTGDAGRQSSRTQPGDGATPPPVRLPGMRD